MCQKMWWPRFVMLSFSVSYRNESTINETLPFEVFKKMHLIIEKEISAHRITLFFQVLIIQNIKSWWVSKSTRKNLQNGRNPISVAQTVWF